jgi:hypothetical protein
VILLQYQAQRDIALDEEGKKEVINIQTLQQQKVWRKKYKKVMLELVTGFTDISLKTVSNSL